MGQVSEDLVGIVEEQLELCQDISGSVVGDLSQDVLRPDAVDVHWEGLARVQVAHATFDQHHFSSLSPGDLKCVQVML